MWNTTGIKNNAKAKFRPVDERALSAEKIKFWFFPKTDFLNQK